jgi:hypothetical protein
LCRSELARRVNGGLVDADFFAVGGLEARWVNGRLVDTYLLTIAWLELGSVLTLSQVDLSIVLTTVWKVDFNFGVTAVTMRKVDVNFGFVVSAVVRSVDVNVCFGVLVFGSEEREESQQIGKEVGEVVSMSTKLRNKRSAIELECGLVVTACRSF